MYWKRNHAHFFHDYEDRHKQPYSRDKREDPLQLQRYLQLKIAKSSPSFINIIETRSIVLSATMALVVFARILLNLSELFGIPWSCCFNIWKHCAYRTCQPHLARTVLLCVSILHRATCNYCSKNINLTICKAKAGVSLTYQLNFWIRFWRKFGIQQKVRASKRRSAG
jgi:hypothetical protein